MTDEYEELCAEIDRINIVNEMLRNDGIEINRLLAANAAEKEAADCAIAEIERLRTVNAALLEALERIDGINDNPARFNAEIDAVVMPAIALARGEKP